jgi:formylglycine-generating enzyme required for sulfatase activity
LSASLPGSIGDYAWYTTNSAGTTHPSGTKLANELGINDLSGNVWEWCWDGFADHPAGLLVNYRGTGSNGHVLRGGSRVSSESNIAISYRRSYYQYDKHYNNGFRVVRP